MYAEIIPVNISIDSIVSGKLIYFGNRDTIIEKGSYPLTFENFVKGEYSYHHSNILNIFLAASEDKLLYSLFCDNCNVPKRNYADIEKYDSGKTAPRKEHFEVYSRVKFDHGNREFFSIRLKHFDYLGNESPHTAVLLEKINGDWKFIDYVPEEIVELFEWTISIKRKHGHRSLSFLSAAIAFNKNKISEDIFKLHLNSSGYWGQNLNQYKNHLKKWKNNGRQDLINELFIPIDYFGLTFEKYEMQSFYKIIKE